MNKRIEDSDLKNKSVRRAIPKGIGSLAVNERQKMIEGMDINIDWLKRDLYPPEMVEGNIENYIGMAKVPIGLAGPLAVNGQYARGEFYVPLATTEGTLVASFNRGMSIIKKCGGCRARIFEEGMQRAPLFRFRSLLEASIFADWVKANETVFKKVAAGTSNYCRLESVNIFYLGRNVYTRFSFNTGDAAGQNMVNKAVHMICRYIQNNYEFWDTVEAFHLASNFCTDKKFSYINILQSRGKKVSAEVVIPHNIIKDEMRTSAEEIESLYHTGLLSSMYSGSASNGLHAANGLAALFIACGQDLANISESHVDIFDVRLIEEGLYICITLPSLIIGTVGGGTNLPTQRECLTVMGCKGKDKSKKFAEIAAALVLAGEISLVGAITSTEWIMAHETMGRNRE